MVVLESYTISSMPLLFNECDKMHYLNWLGFTGCLFVLYVSIDAQDQQLTLTPSTAEAGDDVEMHCVFHDTSPAFTVSIRDYETNKVIWQISSPSRSISVGDAFRWRVKHTDQFSYHSEVTITLTNVTRTDEGYYTCLLEKANQQTLIGSGYLEVQVPPRSMRVFVTSPPPYIESQATTHYPYYTPAYEVKCTFSAYPINDDVLGYYVAIIRRNERKEVGYPSVQNGNVYDVTSSTTFGLSRQNNGERTLRCQVTWKNGTEREKMYTAMLETALNVTFATAVITMDDLPRTTFTPGETVSAMCRAGSANPPHQIDWWINKYINQGNETTYEPGEYNGQEAVSTLRVTAERWMDGEVVLCCLRGYMDVCQSTRISVTTTNNPTTTTVTSTETSSMSTTSSRPDSTSTSTSRKPTTLSTALHSTTSTTTTSTTRTVTTVRMSDKTTEAEITTTGSYNPDEQTGTADPDQSLVIGIAVGVGAAVIVIIVIILAVVLLRRRKGKDTGGKGLQEADKDQEKRLSMNMYDEIDESKNGTNGTKTDRPGVVYEEIKRTSFKTTSLQQRPGYDKLNGFLTGEVKNPTTSTLISNHLPATDPPDTGELYAVVNKPPKQGVQEGRRQSTTSNASSEPDIGPAIQERRKSLEKNTAVADTKASDDLEESLNGATQVEQGRNSVSKDNKKSEVAPVLKPVMKSKPNKPTTPEKSTVTPLKPKVDKANKPRQGLATSDESQSVYYNTREEIIHEGTPKINPASDKSKDNKKNMKKPEDNRTEYYNTHDGVRKSTGSSNAGLDDPYCEIPTENTNDKVEDGAPEYAEIGNTQNKRPQRSTAPLDGSSYHTVDFSQEQDASDSADSSDSD